MMVTLGVNFHQLEKTAPGDCKNVHHDQDQTENVDEGRNCVNERIENGVESLCLFQKSEDSAGPENSDDTESL